MRSLTFLCLCLIFLGLVYVFFLRFLAPPSSLPSTCRRPTLKAMEQCRFSGRPAVLQGCLTVGGCSVGYACAAHPPRLAALAAAPTCRVASSSTPALDRRSSSARSCPAATRRWSSTGRPAGTHKSRPAQADRALVTSACTAHKPRQPAARAHTFAAGDGLLHIPGGGISCHLQRVGASCAPQPG